MGETQVCRTDALKTTLPKLKIFTVLLVHGNACLHSEFERQRNDKKNMQTVLNAFTEHNIDVFGRNKQRDLLWQGQWLTYQQHSVVTIQRKYHNWEKSSSQSHLNKPVVMEILFANLGFNGCQGRNVSNYHKKEADG